MNESISRKLFAFLFFTGFFSITFINAIQPGYTQTNLQKLQNQVADLENRLVDATMRQEKAYNVQMKLEEQELKLASLATTEKYKIEIIEIRADIENIRIKIESIVKEKNDLEENLRLAKNLQNILREAQIANQEKIPQKNTAQKPKSSTRQLSSVSQQTVAKVENISGGSQTRWQIKNVDISDQFYHGERLEIMKIFGKNIDFNQNDILTGAYKIYEKTGVILSFVVHSKQGDIADLSILLNQRESRNSNYSSVTSFNFYPKIKPIEEFKKDYFKISITND